MLYDEELSQRLSPLEMYTDSNNNSDNDNKGKGDKYSLRPRSVRRRNKEENTPTPAVLKQRLPKPKQKPAPLSKYRRKTANARERSRMREINQAFEALRKAVPQLSTPHSSTNEKLTKITTLRLAMKYISTLSAVLRSEQPPDLLSDCSELDCLLLESDGESLPLHSDFSDHSLTPADFTMEDSLIPDFSPLSPDLHLHFDHFLTDFS